jgi:hypothetical protein
MWGFTYLNDKTAISQGNIIKDVNNLLHKYSRDYLNSNENDADIILTNLWLGNATAAGSNDFIKRANIKHIINITTNIPNHFDDIEYHNFPIQDIDMCSINYDHMIEMYDKAADVIYNTLKSNANIFVHCKQGHHRSASVIAYYLMKYHSMSLLSAIKYIKRKRPSAFCRFTCMLRALVIYEYSRDL